MSDYYVNDDSPKIELTKAYETECSLYGDAVTALSDHSYIVLLKHMTDEIHVPKEKWDRLPEFLKREIKEISERYGEKEQ